MALFHHTEEQDKILHGLMQSYRPLVSYVIKRYLDNISDVEEADSRVWSEAALVIDRFVPLTETDRKNLLCTIARRRAIDVYRERIRSDHEPLENVSEYLGNSTDRSMAESIALTIDSMDDADRELLLLRYKFGYTAAELAKVYKCNKLAMYKRIERAKTRLAQLLAEDGIDV